MLAVSNLPSIVGRYARAVRAAFAATLTRAWWEDVAEAAVAQAWQVLLPFLAVLWTTRSLTGSAAAAVAIQLAGAVAVVVVRRLAALTAPDTASLSTKAAVRAVAAAAGALAGFAANLAAGDLAGIDWQHVLLATAGSLGLALLHRATDPATTDALSEAARLYDARDAFLAAEVAAGRTVSTARAVSTATSSLTVLPAQRPAVDPNVGE